MRKALPSLARLPETIIALLMIAITVILVVEVIARYFLKIPLPWTDELARLMLIWLSFLGVGVGIKTRTHVHVEMLVSRFAWRTQRCFRLLANALVLAFAAFLLFYSLAYVQANAAMTFPVLGVSFAWRALAVPVCAVMILIYCGREFLALQRGEPRARIGEPERGEGEVV